MAKDKNKAPPPKKAKDEKAKEMTENAQEESVDYNKFYREFSLRAMDTISDKFNQVQDSIGKNYFLNYNLDYYRNFVEYMNMLQKIFTLVQQIEEKDKRIKKND